MKWQAVRFSHLFGVKHGYAFKSRYFDSDKPSIGLLLCRSKSKLTVEYALRGLNKPIGVADWETKLVKRLPKELQGSLPTVEEIETELTREDEAK
jgi:hypothetical protein